jgi:PPK2 family polyphosphate:nucleotide phosphotransferase
VTSPKGFREGFVAGGTSGRLSLADIDPDDTRGTKRKKAERDHIEHEETLLEWQTRLWAEGKRSLLIVLQGMDTSGKDGTIKHVMRGFNPQGTRVVSFKAPTPQEAAHHFLWRIKKRLPTAGEVVIFNRSHYEDVLAAKVKKLAPPEVIEGRYSQINRFERKLVDSGTTVVKFCLLISFEEQRERLLERLRDPSKRWKFREGDLDDRARWDEYQAAYQAALTRCSTAGAPWYVIPANRKWYRDWVVGRILIEVLKEMNPEYPVVDLDIAALEQRLKRM